MQLRWIEAGGLCHGIYVLFHRLQLPRVDCVASCQRHRDPFPIHLDWLYYQTEAGVAVMDTMTGFLATGGAP